MFGKKKPYTTYTIRRMVEKDITRHLSLLMV